MWMAEAKAKQDIPLDGLVITRGSSITITKGKTSDLNFCLWCHDGIYEISSGYVEDVNVISKE